VILKSEVLARKELTQIDNITMITLELYGHIRLGEMK